jgi:signal transduction histidine kinase
VFRYQVAALAWAVPATLLGGQGSPVLAVLIGVPVALFIPIAAAAVVSLVRLQRRSTGARRLRIRVVLGAGAAILLGYFVLAPLSQALRGSVPVAIPLMDLYTSLTFMLLPVAVGVATFTEPSPGPRRFDRWWPWVLGAATALIAGGMVAAVAAVVTGDPEPTWLEVAVPSLVVAGATALGIRLARSGAAMVPSREDRAAAGLRELAGRLSAAPAAADVPYLVAATVGTTLDLRGTAVDVRVADGYERLATWGDPDGPHTDRPLVHAGDLVGRLILVPHADGVPADLPALDDLLPSVAAVVATVRLTAELERAHERLVRIRDDERARLRADMHDELSPSLSGLRLTAAAAQDRLATGDADAAGELLRRMDAEAGRAGDVVRGILEDLRPDELVRDGLLAAIRGRARALSRSGVFDVTVEAPEPLPSLAPETEVAVYRAATEAVANAARHSGGRHCRLRLGTEDGELVLEVCDDGDGLPRKVRPGVGLGSMARRAEAVGGRLQVQRVDAGGTRVLARFPVGTS